VLKDGPGREVPYATDTVLIHYQGILQPSTHVPQGLVFDSSYKDRYDEGVSSPYKGRVGGFVEGFATALQHMNRGDYWKIYIPYQLAYKGNATGNIPAYSMLTFYVKLDDFWSKKEGDRSERIY